MFKPEDLAQIEEKCKNREWVYTQIKTVFKNINENRVEEIKKNNLNPHVFTMQTFSGTNYGGEWNRWNEFLIEALKVQENELGYLLEEEFIGGFEAKLQTLSTGPISF